MKKKKQTIVFTTDGTYKQSKLTIGGHEIYFESISIQGSKESDFDVLIGLSNSKMTSQEIKNDCGKDAVGFVIANDDEEYDDEE